MSQDGGESQAQWRREYIGWDPASGQRKLVTILERLLPGTAPLRAQSPVANGVAAQGIPDGAKRLLTSAYESRIVEVERPELLAQLGLQQICGELIDLFINWISEHLLESAGINSQLKINWIAIHYCEHFMLCRFGIPWTWIRIGNSFLPRQ